MSAWRLPERHRIGDFLTACMNIDNENDARSFFEDCVAHIQRQIDAGIWQSQCSAIQGARANIGWCFGEGMNPSRIKMWARVCGASHPIFGTTLPSAEKAVEMGRKYAESISKFWAKERAEWK